MTVPGADECFHSGGIQDLHDSHPSTGAPMDRLLSSMIDGDGVYFTGSQSVSQPRT